MPGSWKEITLLEREEEIARRMLGTRDRKTWQYKNKLKCGMCGEAPYTVNDSKAGTQGLCYRHLREMYSQMDDEQFRSFLGRQEALASRLREKGAKVRHLRKHGGSQEQWDEINE